MKSEDLQEVEQFVLQHIDTVPHLEALLLVWNRRPKSWSAEEMGSALFLAPEGAREILEDLVQQTLIVHAAGEPPEYRYEPTPERDRLLTLVDAGYRRNLVRLSRLIHSKPSAAVRAFARAFRLKKERD